MKLGSFSSIVSLLANYSPVINSAPSRHIRYLKVVALLLGGLFIQATMHYMLTGKTGTDIYNKIIAISVFHLVVHPCVETIITAEFTYI